MLGRILSIILVSAWLCIASTASAQQADDAERAVARELGNAGVALYQAHDYAQAYEKLDRAYTILQVPTLGLWSARALEKLGRLVEASERYRRVARLAIPDTAAQLHDKAKKEAATEHAALLPRLGHIVLNVHGARPQEVSVTLDGQALKSGMIGVSVPVDPGTHELIAKRGSEGQKRTLAIGEGETAQVLLEFAPVPQPLGAPSPLPPPPIPPRALPTYAAPLPADEAIDPWPIIGWVAVGLGSAGMLAGIISGAIAVDKKSNLDEVCVGTVCDTSMQGEVDSYNLARHVSTGTIIAGGALVVGGVLTLLLAPSTESKTGEPNKEVHIVPMLGPAMMGVRGTF